MTLIRSPFDRFPHDYQDRTAIVYAFANAGYQVWEIKSVLYQLTKDDYYVCVEIPEKEKRKERGLR